MPLLYILPFTAYLLAALLLTRYFTLETVTNQHRTTVNLLLLIGCASHGYILLNQWQDNGVFFGLAISASFVVPLNRALVLQSKLSYLSLANQQP